MELSIPVIYRDTHLLALNKPAGLLCHPAGLCQGDTLITRVRNCVSPEACLVHRLDRETSGAMVVALNASMASALYPQFARRSICKTYLALVEGRVAPGEGEIRLSLGEAGPGSAIKIRKRIVPCGSQACTRYRVLASSERSSLLEIEPREGRKHQIRAHLAAIGHPVLGDPLYRRGGLPFLWDYYCLRQFPEPRELRGQGLHSRSIEIRHPVTRRRLVFTASTPEDWAPHVSSLVRETVELQKPVIRE